MSSLAHVHQVRCSFRRLLSNHQTWSIATALLSRTYKTVSSGSVHPSASDKKDLKKRRDALIYFQSERRLDRVARQAYIQALHDILKNRHMLGLDHREDGYVSVRELVREFCFFFFLLQEYITHSYYLVELPKFSNVIFPKSPKGGEQ